MVRFALGVVVGVFIAKPAKKLIDEHLTPPVRNKITTTITNLANRLNESIDTTEEDTK
jgi:hypothetical protein